MATEKLVELVGIKSLYELRKLQGHIRVNMSLGQLYALPRERLNTCCPMARRSGNVRSI